MFMELSTPEQIKFNKEVLVKVFDKYRLPLPNNALSLYEKITSELKAEYIYIGANAFTHIDGSVAHTVIMGSGKQVIEDGRVLTCDLNFYAARFYFPKDIADAEFRKLNVLDLSNHQNNLVEDASHVAQLNHGMAASLQAAFHYLNNHNVLYVE